MGMEMEMKARIVFENVRGGMWFVDYLSEDGKCWKNFSSSKSKDAARDSLKRLKGKSW
jgi:hypothetical protein